MSKIHSQNIPLPLEVPPCLDLSQVPKEILYSQTVEALILQTEDLMARLTVHIRRNSILEQKVQESNAKMSQLESMVISLDEQALIHVEKHKTLVERYRFFETDLNQLKAQLELTELKYAELQNSSQSFHIESESEKTTLQDQLCRLKRYHARILSRVRPWVQHLKKQNHYLKDKNETLKNQMEELTKYLNEKQHTYQQTENKHQQEIQRLTQQIAELSVKASQVDSFKYQWDLSAEELIASQNENILLKRNLGEAKHRFSAEIAQLQSKIAEYRRASNENALINENLKSQLDEKTAQFQQIQHLKERPSTPQEN